MSKLALFVVSLSQFQKDEAWEKRLHKKHRVPLGADSAFLNEGTSIACRFEVGDSVRSINEVALGKDHDQWVLKDQAVAKYADELRRSSDYMLVFASGDTNLAELVIIPFTDAQVEEFDQLHPEASLVRRHGFPPQSAYCFVESAENELPSSIRSYLSPDHRELFSVSSQQFLSDPHVLTKLFEKVLTLRSNDQIDAVTAIRIIASNLRQYLEFAIKKVEKDHKNAWYQVVGERIVFIDGGVSRIGSMPSVEPVGIRAGVYSVVPGESNLDEREHWKLYSEVVGDVLNDRSAFGDPDASPDPKRVQEAARYLIEGSSILRYLDEAPTTPKYAFLHGPIQYPFQAYDQFQPNFVPSLDQEFLKRMGITREAVLDAIGGLPGGVNSSEWTAPIPIYLYLIRQFQRSSVPIMGVVERARSRTFTNAVLSWLLSSGRMDSGAKKMLTSKIEKYDMDDEFLFGCILEEGEYIDLVSVRKNAKHRAHDYWAEVVERFPEVPCTMLKTSANAFPFRVEFGGDYGVVLHDVMELLYHTAALLPRYAFPVGIDIADKFAKIPDWLSTGISTQVATAVLLKAMQTGDSNIVQQVRQRMSMTPRDFFYRPGITT